MWEKIKNIIKTMGLFHGTRYIFLNIGIKIFKFNLFEDLYHYQTYKYLKRIYKKISDKEIQLHGRYSVLPNKCWIMWWQGEENAPEIVKKCIASIKKNITNLEVIVLSKENINNYVDLPDRIWTLFDKKRMINAHFSDIVRTYLLYFYGGLWIDATCLLTDKVPEVVLKSELFFFQDTVASVTFLPISNWFIYARNPKNYVLKKLLFGLLFYWNKNNTVCDYFIYHALFKYFYESDNEFKKNAEKMPYFCNSEPHILQKNLFMKFDYEKWNLIKLSSFCHKLTYKYTQDEYNNTFLEHVLLEEV